MDDKLEKTMAALEKTYGLGTIMYADAKPQGISFISTGSLLLNKAVGIGGFPVGRIIEIIGPESSGKTTVCLHTIAEAQKNILDKDAAFIDMEHAISLPYAKTLGVQLDRLLISQPNFGEEALNIAKSLIESGKVSVIVIDSVAALVPQGEAEGEIGDSNVGKQSRMMSQALRMLTPLAEKNGVTIIFTNQIRMKIGVMFGSPETTAGGEALKFYASVRLDIRRKPAKKEAGGSETTIKVIKNKVAPPFQEAKLFIEWGIGIDHMAEVIELAVEQGVLTKSGSWFNYEENRLANGLEAFQVFLKDNPELYTEIESKLT
jgi:recombination protein RecA